jgi:DNA-binding ferritin-like protein
VGEAVKEKEELKKAIEELEVGEVGEEAVGVQPQAEVPQAPSQAQPQAQQVQAPPPPQAVKPITSEVDAVLEEFRRRRAVVGEVVEAVKAFSSLKPEEAYVASELVKRLIPEKEVVTVEKPVVVERPKEVQVPVPAVPKEVQERIEELSKKMEAYGYALAEVSKALERVSAVLEDQRRAREELERMRSHYEELAKRYEALAERIKEEYGVVVKARVQDPQTGRVFEEYDYHPKLKAVEYQTKFATDHLGPAIIQELRQTRSDISASVNRLIALFESALAPELRRRAPQLADEVQERLRRLVGSFAPGEREAALGEIESAVESKLSKLKERAEKGKAEKEEGKGGS